MNSTTAVPIELSPMNPKLTIKVGNLDDRVNEKILWELFIQVGNVKSIQLQKSSTPNIHKGFAFIEFEDDREIEYVIKVFNPLRLYGRIISISKTNDDKTKSSISANIFIGNLNEEIDEKILYETFSSFGTIVKPPTILKSYTKNKIKYYGLICFSSFESADLAIYTLNNKYLKGSKINISYSKSTRQNNSTTILTNRLLSERKKILIDNIKI
mmetsp:Transcript_20459/g.50202  ORF Transcript_20459/g.50202 Transcript_20459/m.50202 type:complete len:213 (+) Transcript_20459:1755-2393(+)